MKNVFFSIVVPVYNRAHIIADTVESVLSQSYSMFELIIIDDGSTDNLEYVISEYKDDRILYIKQSNKERGYSRNHGYSVSRGSHVIFLDSDDKLKPDFLDVLSTEIQATPEIHMYSWRYTFFDGDKETMSDSIKLKDGLYGMETLLRGNPFACNICIDKSFSEWVMFNEDRLFSTMEDWIFLVENSINTKLRLLDYIGVSMRDHEDRSMRSPSDIIVQKRMNATAYLIKTLTLTEGQNNILLGHSYKFCCIHCYIDSQTLKAFRFLIRAFIKLGFNFNLFILGVKVILGIKFIKSIQRVFR